jgi:hypothetical protein
MSFESMESPEIELHNLRNAFEDHRNAFEDHQAEIDRLKKLITELCDVLQNGAVIYPYSCENRDDLLHRAREATK